MWRGTNGVWSALAITAALAALPACERAPLRDGGASPAELPSTASFEDFCAEFLRWYYASHPVRATALGVHDFDDSLPDLSAAAITRQTADLRAWLRRLEGIDPRGLEPSLRFDHEILDHAIRAELLDLEEVRSWRHDPLRYSRIIADGLASLVDRRFAPLEQRLTSLIARLQAVPRSVQAARQNLEDVPPLWVDLAVQGTRGTVAFLRDDVPAALDDQGLSALGSGVQRRWERARRRALRDLAGFVDWMDGELRARSDGDFRLGAERFERKLKYEEHFSFSADELRRMNDAAIDDYRAWVEREAARIDPARDPAAVMQEIASRHPRPGELIPTARRFVEQARDFVVERGLVTLPADELPLIRPTPPYARSGFASMTTPGPFDTVATEAYFNLTDVDPGWSERQQAEHLTYFNYPGLLGIAIHEAMPGHFVQLLFRRRIPSDVRKVFLPRSVVEGWAHYVEQMMLDEGLGGDDPALRLGQLRRALQRHARWDAGLGMHAFGDTLDAAARRFQRIAYFAEFPARRETERGSQDATYLYYALGRMEILRLREDYRRQRRARGVGFSLREFHDRFLSLGLPIPLARRAMLAEDGAAGQPHSGSGSTPSPSARRL